LKGKDISKAKQYISVKLKEKYENLDVVVNVDPKYVYNP